MNPRKRTVPGSRWTALVLAALLCLQSAPLLHAQDESTPKLRIVILEGEGAINNVRQRTAREPVVQVVDENDRPVAGAVVMFMLPDRGAGGTFANGAKSLAVTTDAQGQATATGLQANNVAGDMQIRVSASHQGQTASATITQTNLAAAAAAGAGAGKIIAILAIVGGAAGGIAAATLGGGGDGGGATPAPPRTATISAGGPAVGAPR